MKMKHRGEHIKADIIEIAVERIVQAVAPVRIILFGSTARGEAGVNSDLDVLIVMRSGAHRRQTAQKIYRALFGIGYAVDVVVVTEDDLKRHRQNPGMIIGTAMDEGRELYAA
jgi:uncharacterized protein